MFLYGNMTRFSRGQTLYIYQWFYNIKLKALCVKGVVYVLYI